LLECRKWRRERGTMVKKLKAKDITVSDRKVGGRSARKPWRLGRGGTASRIVQ
jgi:hypothetical protein